MEKMLQYCNLLESKKLLEIPTVHWKLIQCDLQTSCAAILLKFEKKEKRITLNGDCTIELYRFSKHYSIPFIHKIKLNVFGCSANSIECIRPIQSGSGCVSCTQNAKCYKRNKMRFESISQWTKQNLYTESMNKEDSKIKVNNANSKSFKICTFKNSVDKKKKRIRGRAHTFEQIMTNFQ